MFKDPSFWVAVAFFGFVALLVYLKVPSAIGKSLDERAAGIKTELDEAKRLREEAAALLESYKKKHQEAENEAKAIIDQARRDAETLAAETRRSLKEQLERRTKQAEEKIARAEAQAVSEVRASAVDSAVAAAERLLADQARGAVGTGLIEQSIRDLKTRAN